MILANPTVELGTFLFFLIVPFIGLVVISKLASWGWPGQLIGGSVGVIGFIMIAGMALYMFSSYDIVTTKIISESKSNELVHNSTGALVTNSTTVIPEHTEVNPIINDNQEIFGWIIFGFAIMYGILVLKVIWLQ